MRSVLSAVFVVLITAAPVFADQGPIAKSAARLAAEAQQGTRFQSVGMHSKAMLWNGLALVGGGATLAALSATAAKKETCATLFIGFSRIGGCLEETNQPLLWAGIGAAAGGAVLMILGGRRASGVSQAIQFTPRSFKVQHTLGF